MSKPKRHHYVPQFYLRGFEIPDEPERIWVYERGKNDAYKTHVRNVAVSGHYYSRIVDGQNYTSFEAFLNVEVEGPANLVLSKIRAHQQLTASDKDVLSAYISVMLARTPAYKKDVEQQWPSFVEQFRHEQHAELDQMALSDPSQIARVERAKTTIDDHLDQMLQGVPQDVYLQQIHVNRASYIAGMHWAFVRTPRGRGFLTSDNPVFWFKSFGIGSEGSEISFPISADTALLATWRNDIPDLIYLDVQPIVENQINYRIHYRTENMS